MPKKKVSEVVPKDKFLPKLTVGFFDKPKTTFLIWLVLTVLGIASYTTLLKREGFPSINIPVAIISGGYFANDPAVVDEQIAKPISEIALSDSNVKSVSTRSGDNFIVASLEYKDGVDAKSATSKLQKEIEDSGRLPAQSRIQYNVPYFGATGGDAEQIDLAVSFYADNPDATIEDLKQKAETLKTHLDGQKIPNVKEIKIKDPFQSVTNPMTGEQVTLQNAYDRYAERDNGDAVFHNSLLLTVAAAPDSDIVKLDHDFREALKSAETNTDLQGYHARISASFANSIHESISELQRVLIEGLLAVLIVGSIVIAIRASIITVLSMITVILITLAFLYAIGYTLNVITLFALILGLALIVDDTIIMTEAIDAARKRHKDRRKVVLEATRKISRAMVAATFTAALSFAPLLFIGGILGSFIRAIPITIISSLLISLIVSLLFIPLMSRYLLLGKNQLGKDSAKELSAGFEAKLAHLVTAPMRAARHNHGRLAGIAGVAIGIGIGFVILGLVIGRGVIFNIFPPTKDTNALTFAVQMPSGTDLARSVEISKEVESIISRELGDNFETASYYGQGQAESSYITVNIKPYNQRKETSPQMRDRLQAAFNNDLKNAQVVVGQVDIGPPASNFVVQIKADNREAAFRLANDLASYMESAQLTRVDNTTASFINTTVSSQDSRQRSDNQPVINVSASFDAEDTSTLVNLAQDTIKKEFDSSKVESYGLNPDAVSYDIGMESDNQDSFKTLALAFPILLAVMYVLLAIQFRSILQPALIFMAIPFSIFGIMLGLSLTKNPISFFSMLGFFALIGLSIKNTILLTDYANQARRNGLGPIDATVEALEERFRPLIATSLTAVVSLTPLALNSPFWQGLAVVLIFGLLSSTLLVITVFPYYYLAGEYLRTRFGRRSK